MNLESRVQTKQYWPTRVKILTETFSGRVKKWPEKYFSTGAVFWEYANEILENKEIKALWLVEGKLKLKMAEIFRQHKTPIEDEPTQVSFEYRILES